MAMDETKIDLIFFESWWLMVTPTTDTIATKFQVEANEFKFMQINIDLTSDMIGFYSRTRN